MGILANFYESNPVQRGSLSDLHRNTQHGVHTVAVVVADPRLRHELRERFVAHGHLRVEEAPPGAARMLTWIRTLQPDAIVLELPGQGAAALWNVHRLALSAQRSRLIVCLPANNDPLLTDDIVQLGAETVVPYWGDRTEQAQRAVTSVLASPG